MWGAGGAGQQALAQAGGARRDARSGRRRPSFKTARCGELSTVDATLTPSHPTSPPPLSPSTTDKKFYLSDASSQLYRPLAYYLAKISAITPFQIVSALVFGYTVYGMAGLRPGAEAVLKAGLINTLMYLIASQVLHCCAVIAPNQDVAFMLSILWTTIQLLLSGFFVNFPEVRFDQCCCCRCGGCVAVVVCVVFVAGCCGCCGCAAACGLDLSDRPADRRNQTNPSLTHATMPGPAALPHVPQVHLGDVLLVRGDVDQCARLFVVWGGRVRVAEGGGVGGRIAQSRTATDPNNN